MAGLFSAKAESPLLREKLTPKNFFSFLGQWFIRNKWYFSAFFIPVIIMYVSYAIFGIYPFGEESVLVLDLNGQYVYYFEALRDAFWGEESILYNWSRNLSGGYAGIIGYYLASPFTLIVMLLPRTMLLGSLLIMILAKVGTASVAFSYYLQKSKGMNPFQSMLFSTLYALCAYGVIQAMNPMWLDGVVMLPFVALGVEYLINDGRKLNFIIPLAIMFVANFYIGYIIGIFTFLYFIFYLFAGRDKSIKKFRSEDYLKTTGRFVLSTGIALLLSLFMILPVYKALQLGKFDFTEPDFSFATQFDPLNFFTQLLPAQYDSVNVQGLPEIYCGLITVVLLPIFYANKKIDLSKKIGYTALLTVLYLCMYIRPLDMVWHGFQMPNWLPFRYSFTVSFVLLLMASTVFSKLEGIKLPGILGSLGCMVVFLLITNYMDLEYLTSKEIIIAAAIMAVYIVILLAFHKKEKFMAVAVPIMILAVSSGELVYNCVNTFKDEDKELVYSTRTSWYNYINNGRAVVDELEKYDDSFYRAEKTYHRTVNDDSAFGLRGVSHSSSVMNAKLLSFLEALGYSSSTYYTRYDGNTPITDSLLGIKYSMDRNSADDENAKRLTNESYDPVFQYKYADQDGKDTVIDVYENTNALSIGYMADENIKYVERLGNDNTFNSQNIFMSTVAGKTELNLDEGRFESFAEYFKKIDVNKDDFILNNVTTSPYGDQTMYTAGEGDPTVNMHITAPSDETIYMFFKTENQKAVNLWLSTEQDPNGNYINHELVSTYFEGHDYHTINLGQFEEGQEFELRMTVANEYTIVKDFFFYSFDQEMFEEDIAKLQQNQWELTEYGGRHLEGTITAQEGQLMLTSIPYEEGWTIKVDGKKVEPTVVLEALIAVEMEPGEHTVEMTYTPPGLIIGLGAFVIGVVCVVFVYRYDRKNNKIIIERYRAKNSDGMQNKESENNAKENALENKPKNIKSKKKKKKRK